MTKEDGEKIIIFIYLSNDSKIEVDTWELIAYFLENSDTYSVYVPKLMHNGMIPVKYQNVFTKNKYGSLECVNTNKNNETQDIIIPDIVITPLFTFNIDGNFIGYGGGYYDKYFNELESIKRIMCLNNNKTYKVGLSFGNHTQDVWKVENHDVKMDYVVTSTKIYEF